ncbi:hypothetical protein GCM10009792_07530 [Microcella alkalica]
MRADSAAAGRHDAQECDAQECDAQECDAQECDAQECDAQECDAQTRTRLSAGEWRPPPRARGRTRPSSGSSARPAGAARGAP